MYQKILAGRREARRRLSFPFLGALAAAQTAKMNPSRAILTSGLGLKNGTRGCWRDRIGALFGAILEGNNIAIGLQKRSFFWPPKSEAKVKQTALTI